MADYITKSDEHEDTPAGYFDSSVDASNYVIVLCDTNDDHYAVAEIYDFTLQSHTEILPEVNEDSGLQDVIITPVAETLAYTVEVWPKYFFVNYAEPCKQLYHDDNELLAVSEVVQAAVKYCLKSKNIETY